MAEIVFDVHIQLEDEKSAGRIEAAFEKAMSKIDIEGAKISMHKKGRPPAQGQGVARIYRK